MTKRSSKRSSRNPTRRARVSDPSYCAANASRVHSPDFTGEIWYEKVPHYPVFEFKCSACGQVGNIHADPRDKRVFNWYVPVGEE